MKAQNLYDIFTLDMDNPILEDVDEKKIEESQVKNDEEKHLTEIKKENIFVKIKNLILKLFSKFRKKDKSDTE